MTSRVILFKVITLRGSVINLIGLYTQKILTLPDHLVSPLDSRDPLISTLIHCCLCNNEDKYAFSIFLWVQGLLSQGSKLTFSTYWSIIPVQSDFYWPDQNFTGPLNDVQFCCVCHAAYYQK